MKFGLTLFAAIVLHASTAHAIPVLQLYVEGASYDTVTETWEITPVNGSGGGVFRLWVIGNTTQTINDVRLAAAYDVNAGGPDLVDINIIGSTTGGYGGFTDPSVSQTPTFIQYRNDGSTPVMGDGKLLPTHGEYGPGTAWQEFMLGDFNLRDSPIADFINTTPSPGGQTGQINVYEISVLNTSTVHPLEIHFDVYDHIEAKGRIKAVFAPFSHDVGGDPGTDVDVTVAPAPGAWVLVLTFGLVACCVPALRRRFGELAGQPAAA